jgi:hypothetical protein
LRLTPPLNLPAPGRRQTLYVVFDFAESCVFSKQSPGTFHCDRQEPRGQAPTLPTAHLLPKLRCEFAEFLHRGSLKRLGILSPSTCVGLRYGLRFGSPSRFFLAVWSHSLCGPKASTSRLSVMEQRICLPLPPTRLNLLFQSQAELSCCVTPGSSPHGGTGILTRFPSTTPFGLALGTD